MKVTVVVPTFNSGRHIEPLVESMLRQTLSPDEFEVLFVDDGSTDGTPARLEALAAAHRHFRMIRIPPSGWPGRPRNVGVEQAGGSYVQFVDHDDRMAPDALRRLHEMGLRNGSDIVIGKVASNFRTRGIPYALMSRTRERCTVWDAPLIDSLTPHKMFRTAFLREHGIVHPEGPWILEDQLFMVRAYLRAEVVSVLGDYVCYQYWARGDTENAGGAAVDPRRYYANLREIMTAVVAGTRPGADRDRLLRRFYRVEMLPRAGLPPRGMLLDPPFHEDPFEMLRELAGEFVTDGTHNGLAAVHRVTSALLRENRPAALTEFTRRRRDLGAWCAVDRTAWNRDRLKVSFTAGFADGPDGTGRLLARSGNRYLLAPALTDGLLSEPADVTDELRTFRADVLLRHRDTAQVWVARCETSLSLEEEHPSAGGESVLVRPVVHGAVAIDPLRAAGGGPLDEGVWEVRVRLMGAGFDRYVGLGEHTAPDRLRLPAPEHLAGREITAGLTQGLALTVRGNQAAPGGCPPKVSVILPAAGAPLDAVQDTLASLAAQTLAAPGIEVLLIGAAPAGSEFRAVIPPPGAEPRNAGTDAATGAYVLYMEAGDRLAPEALQRMYAYGVEHDADIVVGKVAGTGRAFPRDLFVRDRPRATFAGDPLADSLTPDKLFDRAFLVRHGLRFPEGSGQHPLAEQAFTTEAYLRAGRAAVLGSYLCYRYGPPRGGPAAPAGGTYGAALRTLVDTADRLAGPGAARDRLHRRWLRVEILGRLTGGRLRALDEDSRRDLFHDLRGVLDSISTTAVAGLPAVSRLAVGLLTDDDPRALLELADWEESVTGQACLDTLSWQADGTLGLGFTAGLHGGGAPLGVTPATAGGDRRTLAAPGLSAALRERLADQPLGGSAAPDRAGVVLVLRERATGAEYRLPTTSTVLETHGALSVAGSTAFDAATAVAGGPLGDGVWDLYVRLTALGWMKTVRLGERRGPAVPQQLPSVAHPAVPGRRITPYWTHPHGALSLRAAPGASAPAPAGGLLRRLRRRLSRR